MNLFVTHEDPEICAHNLDDKRVGKMLMEANQMLSLAVKSHWPDDDGSYAFWETSTELTSGWSHKNHPVSRWVRETRSNFHWTLCHARALAAEFEYRFGKEHASAKRLKYLATCEDCLPAGDMLPFQNSARHGGLGLDFSHLEVTMAYRSYLSYRWMTDKRAVTFSGREVPSWRQWD
jgi:Pyrimidine dimer DNA glycosylase